MLGPEKRSPASRDRRGEMVKRFYAQLGNIRHPAEVVEYRVEQHLERLGDRRSGVA